MKHLTLFLLLALLTPNVSHLTSYAAAQFNVRDYGASIGVGLPAPNGKTTINLGVEWRHRESSPVQLITENYLNITLGVNFNELWFWKSRIR